MVQIIVILVTISIAILGLFKSEKHKKKWISATITLLVISAIIQIYIVHGKGQSEAKLNQKLSDLTSGNDSLLTQNRALLIQNEQLFKKVENYQSQLEKHDETVKAIRDFANVALLDPTGKSFSGSQTITYTTESSRIVEPALIVKDRNVEFKCDEESLRRYEKAIVEYPRFPFSYFGMAECLRKNGDERWRDYAHKALSIFDKTIQIEGHQKSHEQTRNRLLGYLEQ